MCPSSGQWNTETIACHFQAGAVETGREESSRSLPSAEPFEAPELKMAEPQVGRSLAYLPTLEGEPSTKRRLGFGLT